MWGLCEQGCAADNFCGSYFRDTNKDNKNSMISEHKEVEVTEYPEFISVMIILILKIYTYVYMLWDIEMKFLYFFWILYFITLSRKQGL